MMIIAVICSVKASYAARKWPMRLLSLCFFISVCLFVCVCLSERERERVREREKGRGRLSLHPPVHSRIEISSSPLP